MNRAIQEEESPAEASRHWAAMAEPQLCGIEALSAQLERVNILLETSFEELSTQFVQMAQDMSDLREAEGDERERLMGEIETVLSRSIMSMQFQDRVSQNLVITMNVLGALAGEIEQVLSESAVSAPIDKDAAKELYHFLRLGEIRDEYLAVLQKRGYISDPSELGLSNASDPKPSDDDIELF